MMITFAPIPSLRTFCRNCIFHTPILLLLLLLLLQGCGYHHPTAKRTEGKQLKISVANWKNETGVLGLESDLLQTLLAWFSKGTIIRLSEAKDAEYFLEGSLLSLRSPGQSYSSTDLATQLQAQLRISYQLKDTNGNIILEENSSLHTESYTAASDAIRTADNRRKALDKLFDDIGRDIYLQILVLYDEGEKLP